MDKTLNIARAFNTIRTEASNSGQKVKKILALIAKGSNKKVLVTSKHEVGDNKDTVSTKSLFWRILIQVQNRKSVIPYRVENEGVVLATQAKKLKKSWL